MATEGATIENQARMHLPEAETHPPPPEPGGITIGMRARSGPGRGQFPVTIYGRENYQTQRMLKLFKKLQTTEGKTQSAADLTNQLNQSNSIMRRNDPFNEREIKGLFFMLRVKYEKDTGNPELFRQDEHGIGFFPRVKKNI